MKDKLKRHWECVRLAFNKCRNRPDLVKGALVGRKCGCGKPFWRILLLDEC